MNIKKFTICLILCITGLLLSPVCFAAKGEITDVERHVPESVSVGEITAITLRITGEKPFMAGIVETVPEGFTFPENDVDVSGSEYFKLDRDAGKIAFAVKDEGEITYNVIPSSSDVKGFEGYWADMLFQTPELNEGKERWKTVTGSGSVSNTQDPGAAPGAETDAGKSKIGWGIFIGLVIVIACVFIWKKYYSGGKKK